MTPGDLVYLRSGGPTMTVRADHGDLIEVDWFIGFQPLTATYWIEQLVPIDEAITEQDKASGPVLVRDNDKKNASDRGKKIAQEIGRVAPAKMGHPRR